MPRCPSCHIQLTPPKDKKLFDCEACGTPLKRRRETLRNYGSQLLFVFLLISLVIAGVGTVFSVVLAAAAGGGLWYWLGHSSLVPVRQ